MAQIGFPGIPGAGYYECDACGGIEGRVVTDSWTGMDLCMGCIHAVAYTTTLDPAEDGDNLRAELVKAGIMEGATADAA